MTQEGCLACEDSYTRN